MDKKDFFAELQLQFKHRPTKTQLAVLQKLSSFLFEVSDPEDIFLLKGFAGTGKTTLISALVNSLTKTNRKVVLLAPTGRAAKVITEYANQKAFTIHKHIYYPKSEKSSVHFTLKNNKSKNTIYIIDEASMISNESSFESNSVLDDLLEYVYAGENCQLILVGDTAQLPPVNSPISPALDAQTFSFRYAKKAHSHLLTEVVRQRKKSGILHNATELRNAIEDEFPEGFRFKVDDYQDIQWLTTGEDIQEALEDAYREYGAEQTCFIVHSNKRANQYNQQIRKVILGQEETLTTGDLLLVVKNNYFWLNAESEAGFIANGDTIEVLEIYRFEHLYGFHFAEVRVQMIDYPNLPPFDTMLLLDTITSDQPSLSYEQNNQLYQAVLKEHASESSNYRRFLKVKNDPYFNALQVKFSYAITCHKSQGGQWEIVFVEKPYLPNGVTISYLRWLYTAITRAKQRVYLINFSKNDFEEEDF